MTDLFTGEGAMILVVPSFSPFSMFAVTRFMLFDPRSKEGKRDSGEEKKGESGQNNPKRQKKNFNVTLGTSQHIVLTHYYFKYIMNCLINLMCYFLKCTKPST